MPGLTATITTRVTESQKHWVNSTATYNSISEGAFVRMMIDDCRTRMTGHKEEVRTLGDVQMPPKQDSVRAAR